MKKNLIMVMLMSLFFWGMFLWTTFTDTPDYSDSERRVLASFPEMSVETVLSGEFADDFEKYAVERFPGRDTWRSINAYASKVLLQKDNNGIYTYGGHISKMEYPMDERMMNHALDIMKKVNEKYLHDNRVYLAVIPDKNRYLADESGHLSIDYKKFSEHMAKSADFAEYIEIADLLDAADYYDTDTHWRQEKIVDVAECIAEKMGAEHCGEYDVYELDKSFNGVYAGQSALKWHSDKIYYLVSDAVTSAEVEGADAVYDMKKAEGRDPYEMFLSGNQPVVTIKNPLNKDGRRLIMFRDSFGSSLAPLLLEAYSEIVLVDLRYIPSDMLGDYVEFKNADVLFIYCTSLLNNSLALK